MKRLTLFLITALLLCTVVPVQLNAEPETSDSPKTSTEIVKSEEVDILLARLEEIKAMDKSVMSPSERKELRKEVRSIKNELKELGAGGYIITVAASIIIILLLILLL